MGTIMMAEACVELLRRIKNEEEGAILMAGLTYRQREIVTKHIREEWSCTQIARHFRVTRERVRSIWGKAVARMGQICTRRVEKQKTKRDGEGVTEAGLAPLAVDACGAARLLSVSPRTISSLTRRGELPSFMVGRRWLYSVAVLAAWVERRGGGHRKQRCGHLGS